MLSRHISFPRVLRAALTMTVALTPFVAAAQTASPANEHRPATLSTSPAPAAPGQLVGRVVSAANQQPLAGVGVAVRAASDSTLIAGAVTGADGAFHIDGLLPGRYTVQVRHLGFAPAVRTGVVVTAESPRTDLGAFALTAVATQLSGVSVTADRATVTLAPDRNSYEVKDMPTTSGGNAVDVLRNIPAIEVDGDNQVSLRNNSNVVVQINGRISPLRGAQLGNFLAQLPANMVARVEVVPNPSAKNDPEGLAGIINIVLKQNTGLGRSGGFTLGGASTGQVNASGNAGYQQGPWTLFGSYGFMRDRRTVTGITTRDFLDTTPGAQIASQIDGVMRPSSNTFTGNAEYKLTEHDAIANNLVLSQRAMARDNGSLYQALDPPGISTGGLSQQTNQHDRSLGLDYAATWRHTIVPDKNSLTTELRYTLDDDRSALRFASRELGVDGDPALAVPDLETNLTRGRARTLFAQSDLTRLLREGTKLEAGYKGTFRHTTSDFDVAELADATAGEAAGLVPDPARSNAYRFNEQVNAAYGVLTQDAGAFKLQGGLRVEQSSTRFDLRSGGRYDRAYTTAFPSAIVSYDITPTQQLKASYSKRIARPDAGQLDPFGFREDEFTVFEGNPALRPEFTHSFELGYQHSLGEGGPRGGTSGMLQITPYLRHTVDAVRRIATTDTDGVLHLGFANAATNDQYGTDANINIRHGRFSGFGGGSLFEQVTNASNIAGAVGSVRAFGWSARANATVKLTPTLDLQGFGMFRSGMRTEQGYVTHLIMTNLALRQKLPGDRTTATLRVMDPFGTMEWGVRSNDARVAQWSERHFGARGVSLGVNYAFGKQPKQPPRPPEPEAAPQPIGGLP